MAQAFTQPLGVILAGKALESARVDEIFKDGRGCTEEIEANAFAVRVALQNGLGDGRDFGYTDSTNAGTDAYGETKVPAASKVELKLNKIWDHNVDLPATVTEASPVEMYESTIRNIGRSVANYSNKVAIAEAIAHGTKTTGLVVDDTLADTILGFLADLEEGDSSKNIYRFNTEEAVIVVTPKVYAKLLSKNLIVYKDVIAGTEGANFKGYFNGSTPLYVVSKALFGGQEAVMVSASNAMAKGSGPAENIKVIDNPMGQGLRLQPLYRMGYQVANAKGVIVKTVA